MSATNETMKRVRADKARAIGGEYGHQPAPILGWHPSAPAAAGPLFFVDGSVIRSDAHDTPYYTAGIAPWAKIQYGPWVTELQQQAIFVPAAAFAVNLGAILLGLGTESQAISYTSGSTPLSAYFSLRYSLIKTPRILDPADDWYYRKLTWDICKRDVLAGTHGTLYDTPANFEDNAGAGFGIGDTDMSCPNSITSMSKNVNSTGRGLASHSSPPYYGLHLWWDGSTNPAYGDPYVNFQASVTAYQPQPAAAFKPGRSFALPLSLM